MTSEKVFEVRDLYNRKQVTELEIGDIMFVNGTSSRQGDHYSFVEFRLPGQVENIGATIENQYKVEIKIHGKLMHGVMSQSAIKDQQIRNDDSIYVYSLLNNSPLFQTERTSTVHWFIQVARETIPLLVEPGLEFTLWFCGNDF